MHVRYAIQRVAIYSKYVYLICATFCNAPLVEWLVMLLTVSAKIVLLI